MSHLAPYEKLLREAFPQVVVREDEDFREGERVVLDVFWIPDDAQDDFADFTLHRWSSLLADNDLPVGILVPHGARDTAKYYPDVPRHSAPQHGELVWGRRSMRMSFEPRYFEESAGLAA